MQYRIVIVGGGVSRWAVRERVVRRYRRLGWSVRILCDKVLGLSPNVREHGAGEGESITTYPWYQRRDLFGGSRIPRAFGRKSMYDCPHGGCTTVE